MAIADTLTLLTALGHFSVGGRRGKRSHGFRFKPLFLSYVIPQQDVFFLLPPSGLCFLLSLKDQTSKKRFPLPLKSGKIFPVFLLKIPFISSPPKPQMNSSFSSSPGSKGHLNWGRGCSIQRCHLACLMLAALEVAAIGEVVWRAPAMLFSCGKSSQGIYWHVGRGGEKGSGAWLYLPLFALFVPWVLERESSGALHDLKLSPEYLIMIYIAVMLIKTE